MKPNVMLYFWWRQILYTISRSDTEMPVTDWRTRREQLHDGDDAYKGCKLDEGTYLAISNMAREIWQYSRNDVAGQLAETNDHLSELVREYKRDVDKHKKLLKAEEEILACTKREVDALTREVDADGVRCIADGNVFHFIRGLPWPKVIAATKVDDTFGEECVLLMKSRMFVYGATQRPAALTIFESFGVGTR